MLEIDARLPSQTPTAVYHSCGINIVALLAETVLGGRIPPVDLTLRRGCCYQHVCVSGGAVEVLGEHMMGAARPLRLVPGLYGADEVITDLPEEAAGEADEEWVATLITLGQTRRRRAPRPKPRSRGWPTSTAWRSHRRRAPSRATSAGDAGRGNCRPTCWGGQRVTRLTEDDVRGLAARLPELDAGLRSVAGVDLRLLALRACGLDDGESPLAGARIAAVPISSGLGFIPFFSQCVAGILRHMGCDAFVTAQPDVKGVQEAAVGGADVVFLADDDRFVALNVRSGACADDDPCTANGYAAALDAAAGGVGGRPVLVMGLGPVGRAASRRLAARRTCLGPSRTAHVRRRARPTTAPRLCSCTTVWRRPVSSLTPPRSPTSSTQTGSRRAASPPCRACPAPSPRPPKPCWARGTSTSRWPSGWRSWPWRRSAVT